MVMRLTVCGRRPAFARRFRVLAVAAACAGPWGAEAMAQPTFVLTQNGTIAPEALAGFQAAANRWRANFTNNVTINITIGTAALPTNVIAQASSTTNTVNYSSYRTALSNSRVSTDDFTAVSNLPTGSFFPIYLNYTGFNPNGVNSPTPFLDNVNDAQGSNNSVVVVNQANYRALGFRVPGNSSDASLTFSTTFPFDYDPRDGISPGSIDFVGVVTHELGHALGFTSGVDYLDFNATNSLTPSQVQRVTPLDLYRYSPDSAAVGAIDWTADTRDKVFTLDRNATQIARFSTGVLNGDGNQASHWRDNQGIGIMDPTFSFGELGTISETDRRAFDVIGWTRNNTWRWNFQPGGNFNNPLNWDANGVPQAGQDAVFNLSQTYAGAVVVAAAFNNQYGQLGDVAVRDLIDRNDTLTLAPDSASRQITVGRTFAVADTANAAASLTLTQGTLTTPNTFLGSATGSTGTFTFQAGTWTNTTSVYVGGTAATSAGRGVLNVAGGNVSIATLLRIYPQGTVTVTGSATLSAGRVEVQGGTLTTPGGAVGIGTLVVSSGTASFTGDVTIAGPAPGPFTPGNVATVSLSGTGRVTLSGTLSLPTAATTLVQTGGTLLTASLVNAGLVQITSGTAGLGAVSGAGTLSVASAATVTASRIAQGSVSVAGRLNIAPDANPDPSVVGTLSITGTGFLDLATQGLVVRNANLASLRALLQTWWNAGARNGTGLGSTVASATETTTLAVFQNSVDPDPTTSTPFFASWGSLALAATDVLLRYTYVGDTNLDGFVDGTDLANLIEGLSGVGTGWAFGDFDYSGSIDLQDLSLYQNAITAGVNTRPPLPGGPSIDQPFDLSGAVPEPTLPSTTLTAIFAAFNHRPRRR